MKEAGFVVGILAVAMFLLGYLQKKRTYIVALNLGSRLLYIAQYILVGAFAGAVMDVVGALSTFMAQNIERPVFRKHKKWIFILNTAVIVGVGALLYKDVFSLFLIVGVTLQTDALWLKNEKHIRLISLLCCPFCFIYNFASAAYGSCIGDCLAFISLIYSTLRYDVFAKPKSQEEPAEVESDQCAS